MLIAVRSGCVVSYRRVDGMAAKVFRFRSADMWPPAGRGVCANVSALVDSSGVLVLGGSGGDTSDGGSSGDGVSRLLAAYLSFFERVAARRFECAVVASFRLWGSSSNATVPFDTLFDFKGVQSLTGAVLLPSLAWVHLQPGATVDKYDYSAATATAAYRLPPPTHWLLAAELLAVAGWINHAMGGAGRRVCVNDMRRSAGEVAVLALRGDDTFERLLDVARRSSPSAVFLAGPWRIAHQLLDDVAVAAQHSTTTSSHSQQQLELSLVTSLSARVFPQHERASFGWPFLRSLPGDDPMFALLDLLLCSQSAKQISLADDPHFPLWDAQRLVVELSEHITPAVLAEDMAALAAIESAELRSALLTAPLLWGLEGVENGGLSNKLVVLQTLLYVSTELLRGRPTALMAFQPVRDSNATDAWGGLVHVGRLYRQWDRSLPPSLVVLLQPTCVFDALLHGAVLPIRRQRTASNSRVVAQFRRQLAAASRHHTVRPIVKLQVVSGGQAAEAEAEAEALQMRGQGLLALQARHAEMGADDDELLPTLRLLERSGADIALVHPFRSVRFVQSRASHQQFAQRWRAGFHTEPLLRQTVKERLRLIDQPFMCVHVRVLTEYLNTQQPSQPHANRTHVLHQLEQLVRRQWEQQPHNNITAVYVAMDSDVRPELNRIAASLSATAAAAAATGLPPRAPPRFVTCFDFGCSAATFGVDSVEGHLDAELCSHAALFRGNLYSSYTLQICARRRDHTCLDLFGRTLLGDDRLLI